MLSVSTSLRYVTCVLGYKPAGDVVDEVTRARYQSPSGGQNRRRRRKKMTSRSPKANPRASSTGKQHSCRQPTPYHLIITQCKVLTRTPITRTTDTSFVENPSSMRPAASRFQTPAPKSRTSRVPAPSTRGGTQARGGRGGTRGTRASGLARPRARGIR